MEGLIQKMLNGDFLSMDFLRLPKHNTFKLFTLPRVTITLNSHFSPLILQYAASECVLP